MMRHVNQFNVFVLAIFLLSGCGTTSATRTRNYQAADSSPTVPQKEYDAPEPEPLPQGPPPPAPPAYGVSHVKSVGFLRVFGRRQDQSCSTDERCATDHCGSTEACCSQEDCAESCCKKSGLFSCLRKGCCFNLFKGCEKEDCGEQPECCTDDECCTEPECCASTSCSDCAEDCCTEAGCTDDRHPCLAERLEDPFLDDSAIDTEEEEIELYSPVPAAPEPNLQPHAWLPSPYSEISSSKATGGAYFPTSANGTRSIVEPMQWPGRQNIQRVITHQPIAHETTTAAPTIQRPPVFHDIVIRPR